MNTAPNRRASDNASSPPGTSPTRRFSDMLKEGSGSDGGILVVGVVATTDGNDAIYTLTKTYREIKNAVFAVIVKNQDTEDGSIRYIDLVHSLAEADGLYSVNNNFNTDNIDGYPSWNAGHSA